MHLSSFIHHLHLATIDFIAVKIVRFRCPISNSDSLLNSSDIQGLTLEYEAEKTIFQKLINK
jgi:hypothetical protein